MNTGQIKVAVIENVNSINATHLMITQVKLQNGNVTAVVTLIDSSLVGFEEVKKGVNWALQMQENIISERSTLYSINNGQLNKFTDYDKEYLKVLKIL